MSEIIVMRECDVCDGAGSLCPKCGDDPYECPCTGVILVNTCEACEGTGVGGSNKDELDGVARQ